MESISSLIYKSMNLGFYIPFPFMLQLWLRIVLSDTICTSKVGTLFTVESDSLSLKYYFSWSVTILYIK